jgi:hypothetical protein
MTQGTDTTSDPAKPESLAGVFGVGLGLAIIAALLGAVLFYGPTRTSAAELLASRFEVGELPEGITLDEGSLTLPSGERVVTFTTGEPLAIGPAEIKAGLAPSGRKGGPGRGHPGMGNGGGPKNPEAEPFDWTGIEAEATDTLPARLYLVSYPVDRAPGILGAQFRGLDWKDISEIGEKGGTAVVGGGVIEWAGYSADFVRQRRFLEGGSYRDTIRVNLSLGRVCQVAYAIWPERHDGSEEAVGRVLSALRPR